MSARLSVLPDCMMPDGAEPCEGYRELELLARPWLNAGGVYHRHDGIDWPSADACAVCRRDELLDALRALLSGYDDEDGCIRCETDPGCYECTSGTVPHDLNTGLCPYHAAVAAVRKMEGAE